VARTLWRRTGVRFAAAAVVVFAAAFAFDLWLRARSPAPDDAAPGCLSDPEFVSDFEVLQDLTEIADSSDGQLLDVDHDEVVMLQLFEDV
jgi:hypothetical protein